MYGRDAGERLDAPRLLAPDVLILAAEVEQHRAVESARRGRGGSESPILSSTRDFRIGVHRHLEPSVPPRQKPSPPAFLEFARRAPQRRRLDRVRRTTSLRHLDRCTKEKTLDCPLIAARAVSERLLHRLPADQEKTSRGDAGERTTRLRFREWGSVGYEPDSRLATAPPDGSSGSARPLTFASMSGPGSRFDDSPDC